MKAVECAVVALGFLVSQATQPGNITHHLKGITALQYHTFFTTAGQQCVIDRTKWNTALHSVANQSTKLRVLSNQQWLVEARNASQEQFPTYAFMPTLKLNVTGVEVNAACAGTLDVFLTVPVDHATVTSTGPRTDRGADSEIWWTRRTARDDPDSFSATMVEHGEEIMKQLVNEWADENGQ